MRIAVDMRWIFPEISGIGAYTRELVRRLLQIDREHTYVLYFDRPEMRDRLAAELELDNGANAETRVLPWGLFSLKQQLLMSRALRRDAIDCYHSTNYMIPLFAFPAGRRGRTACVVTIHDVIPMIFPQHAPKSRKARLYPLYRWIMRQVGRRADAIIADSDVSRRDIIQHLGIPAEAAGKVQRVYCGVSDRFRDLRPRPDDNPARERRLLYVGRIDPYKNVDTLMRAFAGVRASAGAVRLVIAGSRDPRYPQFEALARELGIEPYVTWTGYLDDDTLLRTYREADVLVHPSRYEGFGLQAAEAMAAGLPVVCSTAGSLPEVVGDAAVLVDPDDTAGFTAAILSVLNDPARAQALRKAGRERAARFTWQATAEKILAIYERLAKPPDSHTHTPTHAHTTP